MLCWCIFFPFCLHLFLFFYVLLANLLEHIFCRKRTEKYVVSVNKQMLDPGFLVDPWSTTLTAAAPLRVRKLQLCSWGTKAEMWTRPVISQEMGNRKEVCVKFPQRMVASFMETLQKVCRGHLKFHFRQNSEAYVRQRFPQERGMGEQLHGLKLTQPWQPYPSLSFFA